MRRGKVSLLRLLAHLGACRCLSVIMISRHTSTRVAKAIALIATVWAPVVPILIAAEVQGLGLSRVAATMGILEGILHVGWNLSRDRQRRLLIVVHRVRTLESNRLRMLAQVHILSDLFGHVRCTSRLQFLLDASSIWV